MAIENTGQIINFPATEQEPQKYTPTPAEERLVSFVIDHTDRWRDFRDQNYSDDWDKYERIFRGIWKEDDKTRPSERSRIISPATQQAVETKHAEIMEAIFGQGEYFDIADDLQDKTGPIDIETLKNQLYEDFKQDKIVKSINQIELMAGIYGTGIGEIIVTKEKVYTPKMMPIDQNQAAYGVMEDSRISVKLNPVNPKNFLFDPNGTDVDDCMGVAIERYVSIHKVKSGIAQGKYRNVDITSMYKTDELEPTQEIVQFQDQKVLLLTYYGLVPTEYFRESNPDAFDEEDYGDMTEAIIVLGNSLLLKAEINPYMMKDRPILTYQDDTVPNRLLGRGTAEKAYNMQVAIDASMRSHLDCLALTTVPMVGLDATRLPRGAKFEVKPGKSFLTNGPPSEILYPFTFGQSNGDNMTTSKEFERMLLMATGTLDSQGMVTQGSRDAGGLAPAVAGIIKKYKLTLVNFQEDFLIPFIKKAAWRYMQFAPDRYPSTDVKFLPTGTLGIIAREYEQQQLAFLIQTLGGNSPLTPILMAGIVKNSSLSNREQMLEQLKEASKADPATQQKVQAEMGLIMAQIAELQSKAGLNQATAQKTSVEAQVIPKEAEAKLMNSVSQNLPNADDQASAEFDRRVKIAELMLKEEDLNVRKTDANSKRAIVAMQMHDKAKETESPQEDTTEIAEE